jgi:hypothetical protein
MSVGYVPIGRVWEPSKSESCYRIDEMPDLEAICKSAQRVSDRLQKSVTADMHEMWPQMSRMSLHMLLSCMRLVPGKLCPCMAVVSWGYANRRPMNKLVTCDEFGNSRSLVVPAGSTNAKVIFQPVRCGMEALWHSIGN